MDVDSRSASGKVIERLPSHNVDASARGMDCRASPQCSGLPAMLRCGTPDPRTLIFAGEALLRGRNPLRSLRVTHALRGILIAHATVAGNCGPPCDVHIRRHARQGILHGILVEPGYMSPSPPLPLGRKIAYLGPVNYLSLRVITRHAKILVAKQRNRPWQC